MWFYKTFEPISCLDSFSNFVAVLGCKDIQHTWFILGALNACLHKVSYTTLFRPHPSRQSVKVSHDQIATTKSFVCFISFVLMENQERYSTGWLNYNKELLPIVAPTTVPPVVPQILHLLYLLQCSLHCIRFTNSMSPVNTATKQTKDCFHRLFLPCLNLYWNRASQPMFVLVPPAMATHSGPLDFTH